MNKLIFDREQRKWVCSKCKASYYLSEISRAFDYNDDFLIDVCDGLIDSKDEYKEVYVPCHCMDCGALWEDFEVRG